MRPWRPIAVLLAIAAIATVAGCGGDDEEAAQIPSPTATALNAELDNVQARLDQGSAGACSDILGGPRGPNKDQVQSLIDSMPESDTRSALQDSFDRLWELVEQDCEDKAQEEESQQEPEPEPEPEQPTETQTETETETTPPDTDTTITPTSPEEAPLPNDGDGDSGGGVPGDGNGNGGGGVGPGDGE